MKTRVMLVGGYHKTKWLAQSLIKKGYRVSVINSDKQHCIEMAEIEKLSVFCGDGTKPLVLEDANAQSSDIVIALTDRDDDNLVICELCKKRFHVKKTVALISDPKKTEFFYQMGIDRVVCAISAITSTIEQQAFLSEMETLVTIGEGRISISQVPISGTAPVLNKKLMDINLPKQVIIGCILRGEKSIIPRGDARIHEGDILILISSDQHQTAAIKELTGR